MADFDAIVVGAGVVGLAVGARLARAGLATVIVDGESTFGSWTSSRNSEVVHAGIYYPEGSLKASLCVRGREQLYAYCDQRGVPFSRIGKVIFAANPEQSPILDDIKRRASEAGVDDLIRLSTADAKRLEPELACHEALHSPSTGIVDSHAFMSSLLAEAESHGASFSRGSRVTRLSHHAEGWGVHLDGDPEPAVSATRVINAAGLAAHLLARETEGLAPAHVPDVRYARGNYFSYHGAIPFRHLIYPVPVPGGLGTHLTFDMAGAARFGPDVEWVDSLDYTVDPGRAEHFLSAARAIWPKIDPSRLAPAYAGIRPKAFRDGQTGDFMIDGPETHGLADLVNLFGIESPGLTGSLAIADFVADRLGVASAVEREAVRAA